MSVWGVDGLLRLQPQGIPRLDEVGVDRMGIGFTAAIAVLTGIIFGVSPTDPTTLLGVSILLTSVALLASYIPAHRATRIDPMSAIRIEQPDSGKLDQTEDLRTEFFEEGHDGGGRPEPSGID